jgi:nucleoside-diphosphate-sugar epimerase
MMGTTVVTGGAGFLGLNIVETLLREAESVVLFDIHPVASDVTVHLKALGDLRIVAADVRDAKAVAETVASHGVQCVVHAAAVTPNIEREVSAPTQIVDTNFTGMRNVLEAIRQAPHIRLINVGTAGVYGSLDGPVDGLPIAESRPLAPKSLYAISKLAAEGLVERYASLFGFDAVNFRAGYCFGPWEHETGMRDPMSIQLQLLRLAVAGQHAVIPRDCLKDWTYSRDVAGAVLHALRNSGRPVGPYNLSGPAQWSISSYARGLADHFSGFSYSIAPAPDDHRVNVSYNGSGDRPSFDLNMLIHALGYAPGFGMKEAMTDYLRWADDWLAGSSMMPKIGYRFSGKHAPGLDPGDHAQTIR